MAPERTLVLSQCFRDFCSFMKEQNKDVPQLEQVGTFCGELADYLDQAVESLELRARSKGVSYVFDLKVLVKPAYSVFAPKFVAYGDAYRLKEEQKPQEPREAESI